MADKAQFLQTITQDRSGGMWVSFGGGGLYRLRTAFGQNSEGAATFRSESDIEFTDNAGRIWFGSRNESDWRCSTAIAYRYSAQSTVFE